jgi:hypothetical protein
MAEVNPLARVRLIVLAGIAAATLALIGTFLYWRLSLGHKVEKRLQAIRASGLPTSGTELNKWYASVLDEENAALVLTQAFELLQTYPDGRSNKITHFKLPRRKQAPSSEERELLAGFVEMNRPALAKARQALLLPKSRYPIDLSAGAQTLVPHLSNLKTIARLADYEALLAPASSPSSGGTAPLTMLGLARTLEEEPILISQSVRMSLLQLATAGLERYLNSSTPDQGTLTKLTTALAEAEKTNRMARAFIGERASTLPYFRMTYSQINRLSQSDSEDASAPRLPESNLQPGIFRATGFFERDMLFYLKCMETNIAVASLSPPASLALTNEYMSTIAEGRRHHYILSSMTLPDAGWNLVREAECCARLRLARTALAIEQFRLAHGKMPEKLDDLVPEFLPSVPTDPFDGAPIRYRRLPSGYVVYSVGADGHDDGGREKPVPRKPSDKTSYDVTFIVER